MGKPPAELNWATRHPAVRVRGICAVAASRFTQVQRNRNSDRFPSFRTKLSMITAKGRGRAYVEEQAHGGADDRGAEATGGGAQGRGLGAGSGAVQAHDPCLEGEVRRDGCEPGAGDQTAAR